MIPQNEKVIADLKAEFDLLDSACRFMNRRLGDYEQDFLTDSGIAFKIRIVELESLETQEEKNGI